MLSSYIPILLEVASKSSEINPLQLVLDAGPIVQAVMWILVLLSFGSWYVIGAKTLRIFRASGASRAFTALFFADNKWSASKMKSLDEAALKHRASPLAATFRAGYSELTKASTQSAKADLENVERALRRAASDEMTKLEALLPILATTGSVAPFIGLFGTVWGIMNSFIAIAGEKSASLDVVAPGIAEALIATAIGLVAAIPAVMAYNFLVRRIQVLEADTDAFRSDYLNIVNRHFISKNAGRSKPAPAAEAGARIGNEYGRWRQTSCTFS